MQLLDQLTHILTVVIVILLLVCCVGGLFVFYYLKVRKRNRAKEVAVDYTYFKRKDSRDYIKLEDIKDNMIVLDYNRRFIGAIKCRGFDFHSAHATEQAATVQNYLGFINTINKPITYRQHCKAVDLEDTLNMYKEAYNKLLENLFTATEDLKDIEIELKAGKDTFTKSELDLYMNQREDILQKISALEFRKFHLEHQIEYINNISGNKVSPEINETYIFDWTFNPLDFPVDLSEEEIVNKAKQELYAIAKSKIHSLSNCGVKASRCSTEELIDMCRRYSSPISSDRFKIRDIMRSSYFYDIVTSSSPNEIIEEGIEVAKQESEDFFDNMLNNDNFNAFIQEEIEKVYKEAEELEKAKIDENIEHEKEDEKVNQQEQSIDNEQELVIAL